MRKTRNIGDYVRDLCILFIPLITLLLISCLETFVTIRVSAENASGSVIIANFNVPVDPGSSTFMK